MTQRVDRRYVFGDLLREWRASQKVTQLTLASKADISPRHLSFVENGRSAPSRAMVIRLAEHLEIPLRGRNELLLAAGYAPEYSEQKLDGPALSMVRVAIRKLLTGHNPYPALVVDGKWNLVEANAGVAMMTAGAAADLLAAPCNALRLSLHPRGLAPRIVNLDEWRDHVLKRVERQARTSGDSDLMELHRELSEYPGEGGKKHQPQNPPRAGDVIVPMCLRHEDRVLSMFSTVTTFGTPRDVTVDELAIESFYPADEATAGYLRSL